MKLSLFSALAFLSVPAFGQLPQRSIPRLEIPIEFDGMVSNGEWNHIDRLSLVSHWPVYSEKPNGKTLLRIAYDDKFLQGFYREVYLYFSFGSVIICMGMIELP